MRNIEHNIHLDIGCGENPRNPYNAQNLYGIDVSTKTQSGNVKLFCENLSLNPIPFGDNHFSSVSAYDFLEHIPRVLPSKDGLSTRFPFIDLMSEVWRVLEPGGVFYASTPVFPNESAFIDPTHVNFLTHNTHYYFVGDNPPARMYGYNGKFSALRIVLTCPSGIYEPALRSTRDRVLNRLYRASPLYRLVSRYTHVVWELKAIK